MTIEDQNKKVIELALRISKDLQKKPTVEKFYDFFGCLGSVDRRPSLVKANLAVQPIIKKCMKGCDESDIENYYDLYMKSLKYAAKDDFEQYLLYMEIDRPPEERFYQPRRKTLKPIVEGLQSLVDDEVDELFISLPPRIGKTSILLFFATWIAGKYPLSSNLYSAFSDTITKAFYNGLIEVMKDDVTYHWEKAFDERIVKVNAQYQTVDVQRKMRYPTITCRSIDGTLNGACDCTGFMIADDLCSGIEEALSKDRMATLWMKVSNDLLSRCKKGSKKIWCGTRWSINDPIGVRLSMLETYGNIRYKVINVPAVDEKGESNFNYKYGVGFDTEFYKQTKMAFERNDDLASWSAQYMGQPYEREGSLFASKDLRYFNGEIPDGYKSVFIACDPAWGGGDYLAAPICVQVEDNVYIPAVIYSNEDKRTTLPMIADYIKRYGVSKIQIEANKMTSGFADELNEILRKRGIKCVVLTKSAPTTTSKEQRIFDKAPEIRENFIFMASEKRDKPYQMFMDNVFTFTISGKNKHDDAPDSLAMAAGMVFKHTMSAGTFKRFI